jgi:hypothetical protein
MDRKNLKKIVAAVQYTTPNGEKKSRWTNIGVAFENRDGSFNLRFDFLPTRMADTTIQLRDFDPQDEERTVPPQLA